MGLTKAENSPGLSFELDNPRVHYSPGDTLSGQVVLNTAEEVAIGKVVVSFWGRAKSRIIQQHGQAVTYHRGRTQFFKQELVLYEGQYTHKPDTFRWRFEFIVPHHADPGSILMSPGGEKWKPKEHFRGTSDENNLDLTLPPSCYHSRHMFGRHAECFIEYVLDVTLIEPEGLHHVRGPQSKISTYPIVFHPLSTPEPIQNYNFTTHLRLFTISTLKLLPDHAGTSLGFRDRARSIFQRDTIPKFSFSLTVQAPSIIQLMHPNPIPFLITLTPDLSQGMTTIDTSTSLPIIRLKAAKVDLKTYIRCRAPGTFSDSKTHEIPILSYKTLNPPLAMAHGMTDPSDATLDLGQLCDMRLGNAKIGSRLETPLTPNFTTYNISRVYHLLWELEVECADKTEKFTSVRHGPECTVILFPARLGTESTAENSMLLEADLAQAMSSLSADSTGSGSSSGFWHRHSHEEKGSNRHERLPRPRRLTVINSVQDSKAQSKAQEAAEEGALARLGEIQTAYQRRPGSVAYITQPEECMGDTFTPNEGATSTRITVPDTDQQLPKYVP